MDVNRRREELEEIIARAEEAKRRLVVVPTEDTYPAETALRLRVRDHSNDTVYTYLLLKVGGNVGGRPNDGLWYHTGRAYQANGGWNGRMFRGWDNLMCRVLSSNRTVLEWVELVPKLEPVSPDVAVDAVKNLSETVALRQHIIAVHGYEVASIMAFDKMAAYHHDQHRAGVTGPAHPFTWHGTQISEIKAPMIGTPTLE